ncbi:MAG: CHAT domain-containing protein [Vicinamibacterales bacterium]
MVTTCALAIFALVAGARPEAQEAATVRATLERANALVAAGRADEADAEFDRADDQLAAANDARGQGSLRLSRGLRAFNARRVDEAERLWLRALDAFEQAGDLAGQASTLRDLCFLPRTGLDARLALAAEAVSRAAASGDAEVEGAARHMRSDLLFAAGNLSAAWQELREALRLLEPLPPSTRLGNALTSAGRLYRVLGRPSDAIAIHQRAAALLEGIGDLRGAAQALDAATRAQADRPSGLTTEVAMATAALSMAWRSGDAYWIAACSGRLARVLALTGRAREALAVLDRPGVDPTQDVLGYHNGRSTALRALGRFAEALAELDAVVAANLSLTMNDQVVLASNRSTLLRLVGRETDAVAESRRALSLLDTMAAQLLPDDASKRGFFDQAGSLFDNQIGLLGRLGRAEDALMASERARSRALLDLLVSRRIPAGDPMRPAQAVRAPADGLMPSTSVRALSTPSLDALLATVSRARPAVEPEVPSPGVAPPATIAGVRDVAADTHSTLLAYWVTDADTWIWVVGPDGTTTITRKAVGRARLATLVRTALGPGRDARAALRALYDALVAPVRAQLPSTPGARLTVIPHGPLFRVSFAALTDVRGRYLVEDYALHYASSIGALAATPRPRHVAGAALVVADPESPAGPPDAPAGTRLRRLPAAAAEARALSSLLQPRAVQVLTAHGATEAHVRAALPGASVIHLATHGVVSDDAPWASFLALRAEGASPEDDGRLTAAELYDLKLSADLVMLGACRTAVGPETGDGLTGLTRGFFVAGVPSVIASLWDLPDDTTARLQPAFYRQWLRSGSPAEALRAAQLSLLRDLRAGRVVTQTVAGPVVVPEHPSAWAGLVAFGRP